MEFLLVAPVYFALWGGLFTVGELLILYNRISAADRNMGYFYTYLERATPDQRGRSLRVLISLSGRNFSNYNEADLGYAKLSPVPTISRVRSTNDLIAYTNWGGLYGTALTVGGIEFPSFINGMRAIISLFSADGIRNEDFVYQLGALGSGQLARHYLLVRNDDVDYRNQTDPSKLLETASKLTAENVLGNELISSDSSRGDITQENYDRIFGGLFSDN